MDPTTSRLLGERSTTEPPLHGLFRRKKNEFELKPFWQFIQLILVHFLVKNDAFLCNTDISEDNKRPCEVYWGAHQVLLSMKSLLLDWAWVTLLSCGVSLAWDSVHYAYTMFVDPAIDIQFK